MCLIIFLEIMYSSLLWGGLLNNSKVGGSVANAREANVSIIRFTQSIWIGFRISYFSVTAPIKVKTTATTFTVSWNCKNFFMLSYTFRPHIAAFIIELKLSSSNIISAAYLATSVPAIPIAKPTSAFFKAGASLVPSPVTATTFPISINPVTRAYLSSGLDRANTSNESMILLNSCLLRIVSTLISLPSFSAVF